MAAGFIADPTRIPSEPAPPALVLPPASSQPSGPVWGRGIALPAPHPGFLRTPWRGCCWWRHWRSAGTLLLVPGQIPGPLSQLCRAMLALCRKMPRPLRGGVCPQRAPYLNARQCHKQAKDVIGALKNAENPQVPQDSFDTSFLCKQRP